MEPPNAVTVVVMLLGHIETLDADLAQAQGHVLTLRAALEKIAAMSTCFRLLAENTRLQEDRSNLIAMAALLQTRLQPVGSPPPGGIMCLAQWVIEATVERIEKLEAENTKLKNALNSKPAVEGGYIRGTTGFSSIDGDD